MEQMTSASYRILWLTIVSVLFLASCFLPAVSDAEWGVFMGYHCLFGYPFAMMHPAWYGNVFLLTGVISVICGLTRGAIVVAIVAGGLAASPLLSSGFRESVLIGYWVWFGSFVVFLLGSLRFELPSGGRECASPDALNHIIEDSVSEPDGS